MVQRRSADINLETAIKTTGLYGLLDQPTTTEANRVAGVPGGSSIQVRATPIFRSYEHAR
jgi:hypothetical protein